MILQALNQYYERLKTNPNINISEQGFSEEKISAVAVIDYDGNLLQFKDIRESEGKKKHPQAMIVPQSCKRSGTKAYEKPFFLWDNTGFVFGKDDKDNDEKALLKFEHFRKKHNELLKNCDDPEAQALLKFLNSWIPERANDLENWEELVGSNVVFQIDGKRSYFHENETLKQIWLKNAGDSGGVKLIKGTCSVSGKETMIPNIHPAIKNVRGAQSTGAAIVTFNLDAFCSYNKEQNYNAPIGREAVFAYTTALNYLLAPDSKQKILIGDATTVFWTERDNPIEGMFGMLIDPNDLSEEDNEKIKLFIDAIRRGKQPENIDPDVRFYILGLSPNASRLAVRFWYACSVKDLEQHLAQHFDDLRMIKSHDNDPEFPSIRRILLETINKKASDKSPQPLLAGALMRSIIEGTAYPQGLLNAIINRIRADQTVNYIRAATIKAILNRKNRIFKTGLEVTMSLNKENRNVPYLLGRLFAILEKIQTEAQGQLNTTIKDRFWGSASATPNVVFPQLLSLKNHHISKMENTGRTIYFEKLIGEIIADIDAFPAHFTLDEQGMFAIGYYHQRQDFFTKHDDNGKENNDTE